MARLRAIPAWVTAAILAAVYLLVEPQTADHVSAIYRSALFEREGFTVYDSHWYAGVHVPAYSTLFPPLGALLGPRIVGALAAVAATALFERLTDNRVATNWFALGTATLLITGRLPFMLGVALGVGALVALSRRGMAAALPLAILTALASPVAALFLALCAAALLIAEPRRTDAIAAIAGALVPVATLNYAFPQPGDFPFAPSSFWPQLVATLLALAYFARADFRRVREQPILAGCALYAVLLIGAFAVPSAVGGNAARLGALAAGPILAILLLPDRRKLFAIAALPALYWQLSAPVENYATTIGDDSVNAAYYSELERELQRRDVARVEIPFTENHWEAAYVAPRFPLARGWLRQVDRDVNSLFYEDDLDAERYTRWLRDTGVSHVAVPDAKLDYSARDEKQTINAGVPALRRVWTGRHWTLYEMRGAKPLVAGTTVRLRWTPYLSLRRACVSKQGDFTRAAPAPTSADALSTDFSLARIHATSARCDG